ncbi:hypothetical protein TMEN_7676 [Trichophyton mentagrophytes]|nr:hypothetical protein TMEN_7676 [Trichophyton mentagrophytes]
MDLYGFPKEIFTLIIENLVLEVGFVKAVRLRLVDSHFNRAILFALCDRQAIDVFDPRVSLLRLITSPVLLPQFKYKKETVCDSKPRQHFYRDINELQCPPVFKEFPKFDEETGYENITQVLVDGVTTCKPAIGEEVSDEDLSRLRKGIKNHSRIGGETWTYGIKRRHVAKRREWLPLGCDLKNAVVVSKGYTARAICEHPSSTGPDYGNREEGMFCDMCTKKLWPFCWVKATANCFDEEHRVLRGDHRGFKRGINGSSVHKSYEDIQVWDG